ncbi:MAG TPA: hypothetical protein VLV50_10375 [Stellaceae bacterium]|nr:hypothetical protein [Stellaceae bacterium]
MKARARILTETEVAEPIRGWGPGLILAAIASWAIVIEAVRFLAWLI